MTGLLTLAYTAGLLAPINPCGFALLPVYLTHAATEHHHRRLTSALRTGTFLAVGFAATLSLAGLAISAGAYSLIRAAPQLGFAVGLVLFALGLAGLIGITPRLPAAAAFAARLTRPATGHRVARWLLFGTGYAIASLACTIAVLLAVIGQAQTTIGLTGQAEIFAAYAAGSASLLLLLAVAAALLSTALTRWAAALGRHHGRITAALLTVTGAYLTAYWWPAIADHAPTGHGLPLIDHWSSSSTTWLGQHTALAAGTAAVVVSIAATAAIRSMRRGGKNTDTAPPTRTAEPATPTHAKTIDQSP